MSDDRDSLPTHPTPHLLWVTPALFRAVRDDEGYARFFVSTRDLVRYRGNPPHAQKVDRLAASFLADDPLDLTHDGGDGELPLLLVNCATRTMQLVEGNNRHEAMLRWGVAWFPVCVRVEACASPAATHLPPVAAAGPSADAAAREGEPLYVTQRRWRGDIAYVLQHVFHCAVLDLRRNDYPESSFRFRQQY